MTQICVICDILCTLVSHAHRCRDHVRRPHGPLLRPPLRVPADGGPAARLPGGLRPARSRASASWPRRCWPAAARSPARSRRWRRSASVRRSRAAGERMDRVCIDMSSHTRDWGSTSPSTRSRASSLARGWRCSPMLRLERRAVLLEMAAFADFLVERMPAAGAGVERAPPRRSAPPASCPAPARPHETTGMTMTARTRRRSSPAESQVVRRAARARRAWTSPSPRARSSRCSVPTARARRRSCGSSRP